MKKFAQKLGQFIENSGLKQTHIASSAGISYNYLQRLLSGNRNPSDQVVYKLAEALHLLPQQTGDLLVVAGYAPPRELLDAEINSTDKTSYVSSKEPDSVTRMAQHFYKLAGEIPETSQKAFLEEMKHLLGYIRYKYVLCNSNNLLDLNSLSSRNIPISDVNEATSHEQSHLELIAQIIGELQNDDDDEYTLSCEESAQSPHAIEDMLSVIDRLIGNMLASGVPSESYQLELIIQMFEMVRNSMPWEIRRRIAEALPALFQLDVTESEHLTETLRLDLDEIHGVDIRRRVVEALPYLFQTSPQHLPTLLRLLRPKPGDDIYVALATIEVCSDIQTRIKQFINGYVEDSKPADIPVALLHQSQIEVSQIQRQLLMSWEGVERESLQFSMALHNLLCDPEILLISLNEGLQSAEKLMQLAASHYLEQVLPHRTLETLELYKKSLLVTKVCNVRRSVARALPKLLHLLQETSLPNRALIRDIISRLAVDSDLYIRRAVADHAMQIFQIDREFLLILLRLMHKDTDRVIRRRLQPVALRLAQVWFIWYAETAGLVDTSHRNHKMAMPFGK